MPSLVVGGEALPVLHVSQIAAALGLPVAARHESARLASDAAVLLEAWLGHLRELGWDMLTKPTPSRDRSLRNLTVNVFHPFELLPAAWQTGHFDWDPDGDIEREGRLTGAGELLAFAERAASGWHGFLLEVGPDLERRDPRVRSPRGDLPYSTLLDAQRWHAAFHYRQLVTFLGAEGAPPRRVLPLVRFAGLDLPRDVF